MKHHPMVQLAALSLGLFTLGAWVTFSRLFYYIEHPQNTTFAVMMGGVLLTSLGYALGMAFIHEKRRAKGCANPLGLC